MYILVKKILPKCTEKGEGVTLFEHCKEHGIDREVRLDFEGIMNVTDDFVFAFLSLIKRKTNIKDIKYVRTATYIQRKFKNACEKVGT